MAQSMMSFTKLCLSFWGYTLEMVAKLLNMAPSKTVAQIPYQIFHDKPATYKYLRVWGSPGNVKRLVGYKLDTRSSLCRFVGYLNETKKYNFYDPSEQQVFVSQNVVFLEKDFSANTPCEELPWGIKLNRVSQQLERYGFLSVIGQLDNNPKTYGEATSDIDLEKWVEAIKFELESMSSNKVWNLVDPPKGVKPVGCKWVYKRKFRVDREVSTFKARLVAKGYTQRLGANFEEPIRP
ncbi:Copia protein [Sesamum angolense]|uniref:Copia protein n=1 Tax=Sesamum angolense TaxID=2727404 RepID=A0AAE1T7G6_9LAMI|nr:Copia protein [Sesamum angolense]